MHAVGSILLVDDEDTFRESTCRLLRREGFECVCACNGDEALETFQDRRFDLMISDIRMPGNPDLRTVQTAREVDDHMPVVLVTGYPATETAIRGIELAVVAYLTKPLDFDELLRYVKSAIANSQNRRAVAVVRERLQTCLADLDTTQPGAAPGADPNGKLVSTGTIRTLAACLSELLELCARSGVDRCARDLCELLDCPQQPVHRQAIVDTITVLKKTKEMFKSKDLAELRTRLEALLQARE
jgi:CheY-like chemotaxis protein